MREYGGLSYQEIADDLEIPLNTVRTRISASPALAAGRDGGVAMRSCQTTDDLLFAFVDGLDESLDDHVASCDECQAFLAELWQGELPRT